MTLCAGIAAWGMSWADTSSPAPATASHGFRDPMRLVDRSPDLVRPKTLTVDGGSLSERRARQEVRLAQQLYRAAGARYRPVPGQGVP
ncbi:hypothetical protein Q5762_29315 [Streptomyces sp. P9(2023)]|uniref:hypothetical protein n=1 Tax=Streptomyces sp. P9(2023) TaxID=3064394 RepID=UPI0028F4283D|nr:hypothetical protein [Streptomyces sp. P9(2023)]MDT9692356.1 hypothetical protein [Streptomyces sp. P9(2023)]